MRILITGFEPFGGEKINPSEKILKRIAKSKLASEFKVDTLLLPVSYKRCVDILKELYKKKKKTSMILLYILAKLEAEVLLFSKL